MNISLLPSPMQNQTNPRLEAAPTTPDASATTPTDNSQPPTGRDAFHRVPDCATTTDNNQPPIATHCKQISYVPDPWFTPTLQSLQTLSAQVPEFSQAASGPVTDQ